MLAAHKTQAKIGIGLGIFVMLGAWNSVNQLSSTPKGGLVFWLVGFAFFLWGCVNLATGNGHSGWFGLLAFLLLPGLIILLNFSDKYVALRKSDQPPPQNRIVPIFAGLIPVAMIVAYLVLTGLTGPEQRLDPETERAIAELEKLGAKVEVNRYNPTVGVMGVDLHSSPEGDIVLAKLAELTTIQTLSLSGSNVTDDGLIHLKNLRKLWHISLSETKVTGTGFQHLQGLTDLKTLYLDEAPVTDEGLVHIGRLPSVKTLNVGKTRITDAGLASLKAMQLLEVLQLTDTTLTGRGLAHLKGLPRLRHLSLSQPSIANDELVQLQQLAKLECLWIYGNGVTDSSLERIKKVTRLTEVYLGRTSITDEGFESLQKALPKAQVRR